MPNPLFAQASAHDFECASGLAFTLVAHCVSIIATFDQSSAAANAGSAINTAKTAAVLFIHSSLIELFLGNSGSSQTDGPSFVRGRAHAYVLFRALANFRQLGQHERAQGKFNIPHGN